MEVVNETTKEVVQEIRTSEEKQKLATVLCVVTHGSFPDSTYSKIPSCKNDGGCSDYFVRSMVELERAPSK